MTLPAIAKNLAEQFMRQLAKQKKPLPKTDKVLWTQFYKYYQANRKQYSEEQARALLWAFNVKGLLAEIKRRPGSF